MLHEVVKERVHLLLDGGRLVNGHVALGILGERDAPRPRHTIFFAEVPKNGALYRHSPPRLNHARRGAGERLEHIHEVIAAERVRLDVGERHRLRVVDQVHVLHNHVLAPNLAGAKEAPHLDHEAAAQDVQLAHGQPLLGNEAAHHELLCELCDEVRAALDLLDVPEEPDVVKPLLVGHHRDGALEQWTHLVEQLTVVVELVHEAGVVEVFAQRQPHVARQIPLAHEVVERVHRRLVEGRVWVEGGSDSRDGANGVRPHEARHHHVESAQEALRRVHRCSVAVANRRERHHRPV
mmetsp:Transcript_38803/g.92897  ORF Transcript_38803/g.92897 Transcript_38803/m.92897 type:complete len:294 (+) Transcript_38803:550-1431(+)|eukprot:scaffold33997_cov65-Phaeocystis_antarctica.AAC.7